MNMNYKGKAIELNVLVPKMDLCSLPFKDSFTPRLNNSAAPISSNRAKRRKDSNTLHTLNSSRGGSPKQSPRVRQAGIFGKQIKQQMAETD